MRLQRHKHTRARKMVDVGVGLTIQDSSPETHLKTNADGGNKTRLYVKSRGNPVQKW